MKISSENTFLIAIEMNQLWKCAVGKWSNENCD